MYTFLIKLDFYPYYRLPSIGELELMSQDIQNSYYQSSKDNLLNDILWSNIFYKMKTLNQELSIQNLDNLSIRGTPKKLTTKEFDRVSGAIGYPKLIHSDIYLTNRSILSNKIKDFCLDTSKSYNTYIKAQTALDCLQSKIKQNMSIHNEKDYDTANSFLRSLEYAVRQLI